MQLRYLTPDGAPSSKIEQIPFSVARQIKIVSNSLLFRPSNSVWQKFIDTRIIRTTKTETKKWHVAKTHLQLEWKWFCCCCICYVNRWIDKRTKNKRNRCTTIGCFASLLYMCISGHLFICWIRIKKLHYHYSCCWTDERYINTFHFCFITHFWLIVYDHTKNFIHSKCHWVKFTIS